MLLTRTGCAMEDRRVEGLSVSLVPAGSDWRRRRRRRCCGEPETPSMSTPRETSRRIVDATRWQLSATAVTTATKTNTTVTTP